MEPLTFEQLPQAVNLLYDKLNNIEQLLREGNNQSSPLMNCCLSPKIVANDTFVLAGISARATTNATVIAPKTTIPCW